MLGNLIPERDVLMHNLLLIVVFFGWVLFLFITWEIALPLYLIAAGASLAIFWRILKAQREAPAMGERSMIGQKAVVIRAEGGEIDVEYDGEIWRAESDVALQPGQQVSIETVEGLVLKVSPVNAG